MRLNHRSAPLRFLGVAIGGWVAVRTAMLTWPGAPVAPPVPPPADGRRHGGRHHAPQPAAATPADVPTGRGAMHATLPDTPPIARPAAVGTSEGTAVPPAAALPAAITGRVMPGPSAPSRTARLTPPAGRAGGAAGRLPGPPSSAAGSRPDTLTRPGLAPAPGPSPGSPADVLAGPSPAPASLAAAAAESSRGPANLPAKRPTNLGGSIFTDTRLSDHADGSASPLPGPSGIHLAVDGATGAGRRGSARPAAPTATESASDAAAGRLALRSAAAPRFEGWAYAFLRPGGGPRGLAGVGQLGGSQAAARIARRLTAPAAPLPIAAAARLTRAIGAPGREVAPGIELIARPGLRLTVERRIGLDGAGRDAWAAFAAGGLYRERGRWVADGYAQAGVVGARRQDAFADGAIRLGRRAGAFTLGAGLWGAAQPGVARIDAGPRIALRLAGTGIAIAIEQRIRLAGDARPGSGPAATIGLDF